MPNNQHHGGAHQRNESTRGTRGGNLERSKGAHRSDSRKNGDSEMPTGSWGTSDSDGQSDEEEQDSTGSDGYSRMNLGDSDEEDSGEESRTAMRQSRSGQRWNSDGDRGPHAGKGPKGYRRSDERIQEDVSEALTRHDGVDASDIEVSVENGEVTLSGTVADREMKRAAEDCVENCSGIEHVQNNLRIAKSTHSKSASSSDGHSSEQRSASGKGTNGAMAESRSSSTSKHAH